MKPPRGPRSVLCVVEVTKSASGTGEGCSPTATSPAMCAISTMSVAPISSAISRNGAYSIVRGYALAPAMIIFGLCSRASARTSSKSISSVSLRHAVRDRVVELAAKADFGAVREMAAVRERHAEHRIAGLQLRHEHGHVGLRAGVRLHVGVIGAEKFLDPIDREILGNVDPFASAVIALARITLGVFVGHHAGHGFAHGAAGVVLRGDQLEVLVLAPFLAGESRE